MLMKSILAGAFVLAAATVADAQGAGAKIDVVKQAECGCCGGWVARMREAGFTVVARDVSGDELLAVKEAAGFPEDLWACHTAKVEGYVIEGHVPAREIARLLSEKPPARGLATPGMPMGSPGMDYGDGREAFDVMLVDPGGRAELYA